MKVNTNTTIEETNGKTKKLTVLLMYFLAGLGVRLMNEKPNCTPRYEEARESYWRVRGPEPI